MNRRPFSLEEFNSIYDLVPRFNVEVIARYAGGVILTERAIEPCIGMWHIPGGTVLLEDPTIQDAVIGVAENELGVQVVPGEILGYIDYQLLRASGYRGWSVGMVFEAEIVSGEPRGSDQGQNIGYFTEVPPNTMPDQANFLNAHVF